jgi:hypothetical protein
MTKRSYRTLGIVGSAFTLATSIACGLLILRGAQDAGISSGLVATARLAFLFFWPCYVAGPMVSLFGAALLPLRRLSRDLGLSFAAVEVVHLSLVARLCAMGEAPNLATFILFGSAAIVTGFIALLSFDFARSRLQDPVVRSIRWAGLHLIAYAFLVDFLRSPLSSTPKHILEYLPFAALAVLGPALHLGSLLKAVAHRLRRSRFTAG